MLLTLYLDSSVTRLVGGCDNLALIDKCKAMQCGVRQVYMGKSLDVMDMMQWTLALWGDRLTLDWYRGHPEKRDPTGLSWTKMEWMNHAADRIAEKEYSTIAGTMLSGLLVKERKLLVKWRGERIRDLHSHTITDLINQQVGYDLCPKYNVMEASIDWRSTETVVGRTRSIYDRRNNLNTMWETKMTNARAAEVGRIAPLCTREAGVPYEVTISRKLGDRCNCRCCIVGAVETWDHMLLECKEYAPQRTEWYQNEIKYIQDNEEEFLTRFESTIELVDGILQSQAAEVTVQDIMKGRIPKCWASSRNWACRSPSHDYLRTFGQRLRKLWAAIWKHRVKNLKELREIVRDMDWSKWGLEDD